jgi:hypothetical protein
MNSPEKTQLLQCIHDLAERASELNETNIAVALFTLNAASMTQSDRALADVCHAFALEQIKKLDEMKSKEKLDNS